MTNRKSANEADAVPSGLILTPTQRKRFEAAADIMDRRPDRIDFLHTVQCQCGIPYGNPGDAVREWERRQGIATLRIEAGSAYDPATHQFVPLGLPYGEKPRLVLIHLATEAMRTGSPVVDVEDSMTAFARALGLAVTGPHLRHLKDQLSRLAVATVRMGLVEDGHAVCAPEWHSRGQGFNSFRLQPVGEPGAQGHAAVKCDPMRHPLGPLRELCAAFTGLVPASAAG